MKKISLTLSVLISGFIYAQTQTITLSDIQKQNARATGYAIVASKNPGVDFTIKVIPWDGLSSLENNAATQIDGTWHPQAVIKGNYFDQSFDGTNFTEHSSVVTSQVEFDKYKNTGTEWWIVCSNIPAFKSQYNFTSYVGLGDNAPVSKLDFGSNYSNPSTHPNKLTLWSGGANNYFGFGISLSDLDYFSQGNHRFYTGYNGTAGTEKMVLKSNGYLGLGTSNPLDVFQIGNSFLFHDGEHQIISFLNSPQGTDLSSSKYAAEIRFDSSNGVLRFGTSSNTTNLPVSHFSINKEGNVGVGTTSPDEKLSVNGKIHTKEVKVDLMGWSDFVFYEDYKLPSLEQVERYIEDNGHLKDIPSAKEVENNGILLGEMHSKLLQKIEEITLYTIEQEKQIKAQRSKIEELQQKNKRIDTLEKQINLLMKKVESIKE